MRSHGYAEAFVQGTLLQPEELGIWGAGYAGILLYFQVDVVWHVVSGLSVTVRCVSKKFGPRGG